MTVVCVVCCVLCVERGAQFVRKVISYIFDDNKRIM